MSDLVLTAAELAELAREAEHRLIDGRELAALLDVKARWVRTHTGNGNLPHVQLGRYPRYRIARVREWLAEQEQGGGRPRRRAAA